MGHRKAKKVDGSDDVDGKELVDDRWLQLEDGAHGRVDRRVGNDYIEAAVCVNSVLYEGMQLCDVAHLG